MPQGKVIAVQPSYTGNQSQSVRMMQQTQDSTRHENERHAEPTVNVVFIGICKGKIDTCDTKKVKGVAWYEDKENKYQVGDYVEFKLDKEKTKTFDGVINLKKIKGGMIHLPEGIFSKLALLASLLLIGLVVKDKRR